MKHIDLLRRCAIAASGMSEAEFSAVDEAQRHYYWLAASRALREAFEALKEPDGGMPVSVVVYRDRPDLGEDISESFPIRTGEAWPLLLADSPLNPER